MEREIKWKSLNITEKWFCFRIVHYSTAPNAVIVLEDLQEQSFRVPLNPLNLDTTLSAIYKLAKWHAASIFLMNDVMTRKNCLQYLCTNNNYFSETNDIL